MNLSKRIEAKLPEYKEAMREDYNIAAIEEDVIEGIAYTMWRSNFVNDASKVACTQESELRYIREAFLKGQLELDLPNEQLDLGIREVCEQMGPSNRHKQRAIFYYLLTVKFKRQEVFLAPNNS
ncbi:MAG: DUF2853 family protein [Bacteroidota bacterium]